MPDRFDALKFGSRMTFGASLILAALMLAPAPVTAGEADVTDARAEQRADGTWRFEVTVRHADTGWEHYADLWQVRTVEGDILGERVLAHPHVTEQPFTRALSGVVIPPGVDTVVIHARDSVHGFGGRTFELRLK